MNLNLMATLFPTGYGIVGYHVFKGLCDRGVNVSLFMMGNGAVPWADNAAIDAARRNSALFDPQAPCLKIWHQFSLADRVGRGKFIAFPIFELDPLSKVDVHHMNSTDQILVASHWAKAVCERSGVTVPISVVPLGADPAVFYPAPPRPPGGPCIFLNVGKWEVRKGHDVLVGAFNATFSEADQVELWLLPENFPHSAQEKNAWRDLYLNSKLGRAGKIKICNPAESHVGLADIMRQATCGVFPSRAEGFNLGLLEMMACGKPVIATNYSAHTKYCDAKNCLLIEGSRLVPAKDGRWFDGTRGNWLAWEDAQTQQLCQHMRHVYDHRQTGENINQAGIATARRLTWDQTVATIIQAALA
jgi:hypothetical protein